MVRPSVNLEKYGYKISDIILNISDRDDQVIISSNLIKSLLISNDYEKNVISSYMITFMIQKINYEKIITNMDKLNATFTITRNFIGYTDGSGITNAEYGDNKYLQDSEFATLSLKVLNESNINTINANKMPINETTNITTSEASDYTQDLIPLTLYMYDASKLDKYKINMSLIATGGMNDCIYQLLKQRNLNNLLVDPSTSSDSSGVFAVPYGNLGFNLQKINEYYGIYNYPYLFFMDINRTYLINKGNLGRCLEKGEIGTVNIYLEKLEESASITQTGCYCDDENKIYILNARDFEIVDNDSSIDYVAGGNITTVIRGTGEIKHDVIGNNNIEKTYVVNNAQQHSQLIYNIKESKRTIGMVFTDIDLSIFTPNKSFVIIPDDSYYNTDYKINGKYRLSSSNIYISRQTEGDFKSNIQITLHKVD